MRIIYILQTKAKRAKGWLTFKPLTNYNCNSE